MNQSNSKPTAWNCYIHGGAATWVGSSSLWHSISEAGAILLCPPSLLNWTQLGRSGCMVVLTRWNIQSVNAALQCEYPGPSSFSTLPLLYLNCMWLRWPGHSCCWTTSAWLYALVALWCECPGVFALKSHRIWGDAYVHHTLCGSSTWGYWLKTGCQFQLNTIVQSVSALIVPW